MKLLGFIMMICIISAGIFMQSCGRYDDTHEIDQVDLVGNSVEYENYLMEVLAFVKEQNEMQNSRQIVGQVNGMNIYKTSSTKITRKSLSRIFDTHEALTKKFPQYAKMDNSRKAALLNKAAMKSKKISDLISIKQSFSTIRLKQSSEPPPPALDTLNYFLVWYATIDSAFEVCRMFSRLFGVETGGIIFNDSSAVFVYDPAATDTSMTIPIWRGMGASTSFHFHPGLDASSSMSSVDSLSMRIMQRYGIDSLIIITNDTISGYGF